MPQSMMCPLSDFTFQLLSCSINTTQKIGNTNAGVTELQSLYIPACCCSYLSFSCVSFYISGIKACIMEAEVIRLLSSGCGTGQPGAASALLSFSFTTGHSDRRPRQQLTYSGFFLHEGQGYPATPADRQCSEVNLCEELLGAERLASRWNSDCRSKVEAKPDRSLTKWHQF